MLPTKRCSACKQPKELASFYYEARSQRHLAQCKSCVGKYHKGRRANRSVEDYYASAERASYVKRKADNPQLGQYHTKTKASKKKACSYVKAWRARNREQFNTEQATQLRLKRSMLFKDLWPLVLEHYDTRCLGCGSTTRKLCFDHVLPLIDGGSNCVSNGQPLCRHCNSFKGSSESRDKDHRPEQGAWELRLVESYYQQGGKIAVPSGRGRQE